MTAGSLPEGVEEFLKDRIQSFEELEALRLLRGEPRERWSADAIGTRLNLPASIVEQSLERLRQQGLLALRVEGGITIYRYEVAEPALDSLVARLMRANDENRIEVMKLMAHNAVERVRGTALRTFADAFLVGRKKDG